MSRQCSKATTPYEVKFEVDKSSQEKTEDSKNEKANENDQRVFYTHRDSRRVRFLKRLHIIPKSPSSVTYAQLGVQADLPVQSQEFMNKLQADLNDALVASKNQTEYFEEAQTLVSEMESAMQHVQRQMLEIQGELESKSDAILELREKLNHSEQEVEKLRQDHRSAALEITEQKMELTQAEIQLHELEKQNAKLRSQITELKLEVERLELDVAFLAEEKGDLESSLEEHKSFLDIVTKEKDHSFSKEEELKNTLLRTKIESAEQVGNYIDELNAAHEEKRKILSQKFSGASKDLQRAVATTDHYLKLKEEKNRLADQVELLSTQAVFQDLLIEKYHGQLFRLAKLVENEQKRKGDDNSLLNNELIQALNLVKKRPNSATYTAKKSHQKTKYMPEPRNCASLPGSPLRPSKHLRSSEPVLGSQPNKVEADDTTEPSRAERSVKSLNKPKKDLPSEVQETFYSPKVSPKAERKRSVFDKHGTKPWSTDTWRKIIPNTSRATSKKPLLQ